jgi:limonene 1,2-monooxygenase
MRSRQSLDEMQSFFRIGQPAVASAHPPGTSVGIAVGHNWANQQATAKSFELIARHVVPHFQGQARSTLDAAERARAARPELAGLHAKAVEAAGEHYAKDRGERAH